VVAGCFTNSKTCSANIVWGREALELGTARILIVNSGNANAFNGRSGEESVERIVNYAAQKWNCDNEEIYPCATGVIGEPLPDDKITKSLSSLKDELKPDIWEDVAKAIMTTDTYPKGSTKTAVIGDKDVQINGIAKGSGMIAPDMATMLAYIFTDANIEQHKLQKIFNKVVNKTFNSITVDSDTSTSDTALIFATGKAGNDIDADLTDFKDKLELLLLDLSHQIVKDGEGASKFIKITVTGAENDKSAKIIAMSIANSPLVKTAIAGEDANWGRIVMAVGKAGEAADRDSMSVSVGGIQIVKNGQLNPSYNEADVTAHMRGYDIEIITDVGIDDGKAIVWTCDLTHDYITINADYRS
jgi:glutamate N-acetyltransferase/amino-acid N-acetyltransferase